MALLSLCNKLNKSIPAIQGDMDCVPGTIQRKCEMLRLWNRLIKMVESRINKKVFMSSKGHDSPWKKELSSIFEEVDVLYIYRSNLCCSINSIKNKFLFRFEETWSKNVLLKPKLKTYIQIKENFAPETYVLARLSRNQRSLVAQLRTGILPLAIETGRFNNILEDNRLCEMCDLNDVESESHFLLYCTLYDDLRECLFNDILQRNPDMFYWSDEEKLKWLFDFDIFGLAIFISKAWKRRQDRLF